PISDPWAGRYPRPSACNARGQTAASPSSPATALCSCTASRGRPRRATDCRSSTRSSAIPPPPTSDCPLGDPARRPPRSPAFARHIGVQGVTVRETVELASTTDKALAAAPNTLSHVKPEKNYVAPL